MGKPELKNFVRVPMMFLQAGAPLPVSLYLYSSQEKKIYAYKSKSEILDLNSLVQVMSMPPNMVLALRHECEIAVTLLEQTMHEGHRIEEEEAS